MEDIVLAHFGPTEHHLDATAYQSIGRLQIYDNQMQHVGGDFKCDTKYELNTM